MLLSSAELRSDTREQLANRPPFRRLRGYAFDPSLSLQLETAAINHALFVVPWEQHLAPGPIGEYLEVVDFDPASAQWYEPVDLNAINILAQDGLAPSLGNPQFHQQMVYAVAMNTIKNFERALGRSVLWSALRNEEAPNGQWETFVQRLRIYPHAMRAANAYYSPEKKALLFGYFQGPTGTVFGCLSQDIIAHETTHALLDGMHRRYIEDNHPDTLAFHEAFADLVALLQHFTFPEVLKSQIAKTRGNLESQSLLGELAQEFGKATGRYGALRSAIGDYDDNKRWKPNEPDPQRLQTALEPHERGSILVAAVFAAFVAIYKARTRDIVAQATAGSGVLPEGALNPLLTGALANEAAKTASHFLGMCIRALDYCPPFDITFGDYLRALITADYDMVPDDRLGYRVALIESFRQWGIVPEGLKTLSEEQLRWQYQKLKYDDDAKGEQWNALADLAIAMKPLISTALYAHDRKKIFENLRDARGAANVFMKKKLQEASPAQRENLNRIVGVNFAAPKGKKKAFLAPFKTKSGSSFEVHLVVPTLRVTPDGQIMKQLIISMTQRLDKERVFEDDPESETFDFRGGSTLIFDMEGDEPTLRYAITRSINDKDRLEAIRAHRQARQSASVSLQQLYFGKYTNLGAKEPFCMLHSEH